jgi:hypothetical protein
MELLIALSARSNAIDDLQAGEVITIQPDGWPWSAIELTHPGAQIISAPILQSHAQTLMHPHTLPHLRTRGVKYPRKAYLLDLSKLPNPEHFKPGQRTQSKVTLQRADVENASIKVSQ